MISSTRSQCTCSCICTSRLILTLDCQFVLSWDFNFNFHISLLGSTDSLSHWLTSEMISNLLLPVGLAGGRALMGWDGLILEKSRRKKLREIWLAIYWGSGSNRASFMKCDLWGSLDLITSKRLHQTGTTISPATCKVSPPNPSPYTVQMSIFDFIRGCCWWVGGCGCYIIKTPSGKRHDKGASHTVVVAEEPVVCSHISTHSGREEHIPCGSRYGQSG